MRHLLELVETNISKEELLKAIEKDGYDFDNESEKWIYDVGFFKIKYNEINIADLVLIDEGGDGYYFDKIDLLFSIKAKVLDDIVEKEYFYKEGEWFYKKDGDKIGNDIEEVYNHIGCNGCVAYDENMLILTCDEAENDPYPEIDNDTTFNNTELAAIYKGYSDFHFIIYK